MDQVYTINQIPVEILQEIFLYVGLYGQRHFSPLGRGPAHLVLPRVCSLWRSIYLTLPNLYPWVKFLRPCEQETADRFLAATHPRPVAIDIDSFLVNAAELGYSAHLWSCTERWGAARVIISLSNWSLIADCNFPQLSALKVRYYRHQHDRFASLPTTKVGRPLVTSAPQLTALDLDVQRWGHFNTFGLPWSQIELLTLRNAHLAMWLTVLERCPLRMLRLLNLDTIIASSMVQTFTFVPRMLRNLHTLIVDVVYGSVSTLLNVMTAPALHSLSVTTRNVFPDSEKKALGVFLERSKCTIRNLRFLFDRHIRCDSVVSLIHDISSVENLYFTYLEPTTSSSAKDVMDLLARKSSDDQLTVMPNLRSLEIMTMDVTSDGILLKPLHESLQRFVVCRREKGRASSFTTLRLGVRKDELPSSLATAIEQASESGLAVFFDFGSSTFPEPQIVVV
ncbi:hypothetical protein FISHEDRAFT_68959 [Fistulina hepatica ATCC 64428]|uniref:F-box domain-containing protein n=1 Tax=Fistulina hepatica ATCC 64428 TaxID=1128425 RepID=A0A0D7APW2_9AGAR|nr:hypothetical protein FISHEDRAFT_68959 [Fistulina hepatica ATCC 64428]